MKKRILKAKEGAVAGEPLAVQLAPFGEFKGVLNKAANTIDANGMEHDELGRFGEGGGVNPDSAEVKTKEILRGRAALEKCLSEGVDVRDAVKRGDPGSISLVYGDETGGLAHFKDRKDAVEHLIELWWKAGRAIPINTARSATSSAEDIPRCCGRPGMRKPAFRRIGC